MLDERETQAPPAAAPEGHGAGDFHPEQFMPPAPSRWAQPLLIGVGAVAVLAALGMGTLWMQDEHKANASLDVLASSARQAPAAAPVPVPVPAPSPALPKVAPAPLPPLVMLEPDPPLKVPAPAPAKSEAPVAGVASQAAPARIVDKARPKAVPRALAARAAPAPAPKGITLPAPRPKGITLPPPSPRGITLPPPSSGRTLLAEQMKRCKTGDLARECLDDLCRHGGRGDPACRARLLVD